MSIVFRSPLFQGGQTFRIGFVDREIRCGPQDAVAIESNLSVWLGK